MKMTIFAKQMFECVKSDRNVWNNEKPFAQQQPLYAFYMFWAILTFASGVAVTQFAASIFRVFHERKRRFDTFESFDISDSMLAFLFEFSISSVNKANTPSKKQIKMIRKANEKMIKTISFYLDWFQNVYLEFAIVDSYFFKWFFFFGNKAHGNKSI